MKMLSQLIQQAAGRHRLIASTITPTPSPSRPSYASQDPPSASSPSPPRHESPHIPPLSSKSPTIYSQLMKKHDRLSERHIKHT